MNEVQDVTRTCISILIRSIGATEVFVTVPAHPAANARRAQSGKSTITALNNLLA